MVKVALVAPLMLALPFRHWKVGVGVPLAAAVKVTGEPTVTDWLAGWVVNEGAVLPELVTVMV